MTTPAPAELNPRERFHPRVGAGFMVKLLIDRRVVLAKARDLSMAGLFVLGADLAGRATVTLTVPLPGDREVVTRCLVRRVSPDGAALEFEHIDWDDMFALARFLHPRLP